MNRHVFVVLSAIAAFNAAAIAGTLHGKVSGVKGESVVYVEAVAGKTFPAPTQHITIDQKGLMFVPHIVAIQQGTTVEFLNSDSVAHNVFWSAINGNKKLGHNLGTWPQGQRKSFQFQDPGVIPLLCNVHPEMSAFVIVSPTPYFAETDKSGAFSIDNVPDGAYTVTAWHEGAKSKSNPVKVAGDTSADFALSK
ncbi:MAG TPA: carboxypeptidase regulatory-like domain-containing protein [Terracidiphilus sp.]|jgi:plastocyanin|nr:carboxypeptidase regulatory-like domain-containing protein [Terracidiphilus sp.]